MNALATLSEEEIDMVSGGNALDTTTGSYVPATKDADSSALVAYAFWKYDLFGVAIRPLRKALGY